MDIEKFMTPRLKAVASYVKKGSVICDVGTDHAYIPIWLVKNEICNFGIAMDINHGPLLRAEENIKRFNFEDSIKTRISDGLLALNPAEADTVVIAGMGGILINRILDNSKELYSYIKQYILQPMTAVEETRRFLYENGFCIEDECLVKEDNKIYTVISATRGSMTILEEIDFYIGKKLIEKRDKNLKDYLNGKIYELNKAIDLMTNTKNKQTAEKRSFFVMLKGEMEKIKEECEKW